MLNNLVRLLVGEKMMRTRMAFTAGIFVNVLFAVVPASGGGIDVVPAGLTPAMYIAIDETRCRSDFAQPLHLPCLVVKESLS